MRVAFIDDFHHAYEETQGVRRLREFAEVVIFKNSVKCLDELRDFEAIVATRERTHLTADLFQSLPNLRIIAQTGNHAYHVDLVTAEKHGVIIGKAAGGFCGAAGELTFGLMMAVMRQISQVDHAIKSGGWPTPMTRVLHGKTLGIVGFGKIGQYVARIANAFGMNVIAWGSRLTDEGAEKAGARRAELDDLMRQSDVISIHATLTDQSRDLIDAKRLSLCKPSAYLINTARGPIVNEAALVAALSEGKLAGAGLDVFDIEPLPADHPLRFLNNVVTTSHLGWPTDEMYEQFANAAADVLLAYHEKRELPQFSLETELH
ncbi:D-2-hydroxyacid dehydrogenase family protein [Eoetvoesiella caeni]